MRTTAQLREHILAAARTEFAQYGLAGARIDRIARAAQASKERLYAHFGDKQTLFREVVSADFADFVGAVTLDPTAVAEFVGEIYDLACSRPEHLRMITWAKLEGFALDPPQADGTPVLSQLIGAVEAAQNCGHADRSWRPDDLLVLLFGIALAWAHSPDPQSLCNDPRTVAHRRTAAVEAARRVVNPAT